MRGASARTLLTALLCLIVDVQLTLAAISTECLPSGNRSEEIINRLFRHGES